MEATNAVGQRVYVNEFGHLIFNDPGDYGQDKDGIWWARVPKTGFPMGRLTDHTVTEHEDGTITVEPSIFMEGSNGKTWHGYLERGIWREVDF